MFENYTLSTASRHPSSLPCRESPFGSQWTPNEDELTSSRKFSVSQLSQQFSEQRIHADLPTESRSEPHSIAAADCFRQHSRETSPDSVNKMYVGITSPSRRRLQRQQGVRMLCDPAHLQNIQAMVEKMIQTEDQCLVSPAWSTSSDDEQSPPNPEDDEGYSSYEDKRSSPSQSFFPPLQLKKSAELPASRGITKGTATRKDRKRRSYQKAV